MKNYDKLSTLWADQHGWKTTRTTWVDTEEERSSAARALRWTFLLSYAAILGVGIGTLLFVPTADVYYEGLAPQIESVNCLRLARRGDYSVVFVGIGSPAQYLKLMLRMDRVVDRGEPSLEIFSERMHKSQTLSCVRVGAYVDRCVDAALLLNGTEKQNFVHTEFLFQNDYYQSVYLNNRAHLVGLDGMMNLVAGTTYWLTATHLCFADYQPETALANDSLAFASVVMEDNVTRMLHTEVASLAQFTPLVDAPATASESGVCENVVHPNGIELFPVDAAAESDTWLVLSSDFLYEYGQNIVEQRRDVVETGSACASLREEMRRVYDLYQLDCGLHFPSSCRTVPSVPYRRLANFRIRIDVGFDGAGELRADSTIALSSIPNLRSYGEGLRAAFVRLVVMIFTAAVVFVRGSQNASSSKYMIQHTLNVVRCRAPKNPFSFEHSKWEVAVDTVVTIVALASRIFVFATSASTLIADNHTRVVVFESLGIFASLLHMILRIGVLQWDLEREAPLTKLAGPMSLCDVSAAVLLAFADPPLLATHDGRFAAVGRLLIGILISISVFSRCAYAAAMCALLADTVVNGEHFGDIYRYKTVLIVATVLWMLQGAVCCGTLCALFVNPAAYSIVRMQVGDTDLVRFCLFFGVFSTGLPTLNKVALRALQSECDASTKKDR